MAIEGTAQRGQLGRRRVLQIGAAALGTPAAVGGLAACGDASGSGSGGTELVPPNVRETDPIEGLVTSDVEGTVPMLLGQPTEYVQSVAEVPGAGNALSSFQILWGAPPPGRDRNEVWKQLEANLGVSDFEITLVPSSTYSDKLATTIASGDLPDLLYLQYYDVNAARAISDGAFAELNEFLEGDAIDDYPNLATTPESIWRSSARHGKLYGIPQPAGTVHNLAVMRLDAMKLVGVDAVPDNAEDLKDLWLEMATIQEIGGRRVWGHGVMNAHNFEPAHDLGQDYQIVDGKVTNKWLTPNFEEHLAWMAELWKGGFFHPDALAKTDPALFSQGQQLNHVASFGGFYQMPEGGAINEALTAVPEAEFIHYAMPSVNGGTGVHKKSLGWADIVCIPSALQGEPERIKELLRVCNYYRAPLNSTERLFLTYGIEGRQWEWGDGKSVAQIEGAPVETDMTWLGLLGDPVNQMPLKNESLMTNVMETYEAAISSGETNELDEMFNEPQSKNAAKLHQLYEDYFNGIVSGRRPLSDVEQFRSEWLSGGGQDVLDEYERQLDEA